MAPRRKSRAARAEPRRSPEFFRTAVEAAPNAMIVVDAAGRITMVNAATERMFGYPRQELIGEEIEVLLPEAIRGRHVGFRNDFMKTPSTRAMGAGRELLGRRKDGAELQVEIGLNPIHSPDGVLVRASSVDIAERVKAAREKGELEERVRHSQKLESL
ncbi:MAG: hypothetical protein DPW14_16710, partial [Planctomycetes bacterium]|nr:hypothetical protein [Planctomycetota bacterium]